MPLSNGLDAVDHALGQEYSLADSRESPVSYGFVVHLRLDPAPLNSSAWRKRKGKRKSGKGKFLLKIVPSVLEQCIVF